MRLRLSLSILSILILILVVISWARSPRYTNMVGVFLNNGRLQAIASHAHSVLICFSNLEAGQNRAYSFDFQTQLPEQFQQDMDSFVLPYAKVNRQRFGFSLISVSATSIGTQNGSVFILGVPHWFLLLLTSVPPIHHAILIFRARRRRRCGFCAHCGYDLRASPGPCPECGRPHSRANSGNAPGTHGVQSNMVVNAHGQAM
jgi:hypothetical protein